MKFVWRNLCMTPSDDLFITKMIQRERWFSLSRQEKIRRELFIRRIFFWVSLTSNKPWSRSRENSISLNINYVLRSRIYRGLAWNFIFLGKSWWVPSRLGGWICYCCDQTLPGTERYYHREKCPNPYPYTDKRIRTEQ